LVDLVVESNGYFRLFSIAAAAAAELCKFGKFCLNGGYFVKDFGRMDAADVLQGCYLYDLKEK
ncbi:hypothetical protein Prudu_015956, partial [Prunus dulcis]